MTPELEALAVRCERASGPSDDLDCVIAVALRVAPHTAPWAAKFPDWRVGSSFGRARGEVWDDGQLVGHWTGFKPYTASLDAAMTLIEPDEYWRLGNDGEGPDVAMFKASVTSHDDEADLHFHDAVAETPALALTASALRAITPTQNHKGPHDE